MAIKNAQILDNAYGILGIEFMAAAQALDLHDLQPGRGVRTAHEVIRRHVAHLDEDRPLQHRPRGDEGPGPVERDTGGGRGRGRIAGVIRTRVGL